VEPPKVQLDNTSNPLLRAWCLFEIHTTVVKDNALVIKMGGTNTSPIASAKNRKTMEQDVELNNNKIHELFEFIPEFDEETVTKLLFSIDIKNASDAVATDLVRIRKMIQEQGGFNELNSRVRTSLYNKCRIMQIPAVQYALSGSEGKVKGYLKMYDPETYEGDPGGSLLHDLVHGNLCKEAQLAISCGASIDQQTVKGNTPLIVVAEGERVKMCKLLLDNGAKIDLQNTKKETAPHLAAKYGRVECVKLLLSAGADPSIVDSGDIHLPPAVLARLDKMPGCKEVLLLLEPDSVSEAEKQDCFGAIMACFGRS